LEVTGGVLILGDHDMMVWRRSPSPQASGALYGLIAVTPAAGYVSPGEAIAIGAIASVLIYFIGDVFFKLKFACCLNCLQLLTYDFLGVFVFHGLSGLIGTLLTGLFAEHPFLSTGELLLEQIISIAVACCVSVIGTFVCLLVVSGIFLLTDKIPKKSLVNCFVSCRQFFCCGSCFPTEYEPVVVCKSCDCGMFAGWDRWIRKPIIYDPAKQEYDKFLSVDDLQYNAASYDITSQSSRNLLLFLERKFENEIMEENGHAPTDTDTVELVQGNKGKERATLDNIPNAFLSAMKKVNNDDDAESYKEL